MFIIEINSAGGVISEQSSSSSSLIRGQSGHNTGVVLGSTVVLVLVPLLP
ncbi:hypothetical protein [Pontimicrobium sp. MEBiC06410]